MRKSFLYFIPAIFLAACGGPDPDQTACFNDRTGFPFSAYSGMRSSVGSNYLETVRGCSNVLASLKSDEAQKRANTLIRRAKAYVSLGKAADAHADIAAIRDIATSANLMKDENYIRGIALTLDAMDAMLAYGEGRADEGQAAFEKLVGEFPYVQPLSTLAMTYAIGRNDYAWAAETSILPGRLSTDETYAMLTGRLLEMAGKNEEAAQFYRGFKNDTHSMIRLAHLMVQQDRIGEAKEALAAAKDETPAEPAEELQGWQAFAAAQRNEARSALRRVENRRLAVLEALIRFAETEDPVAVTDVLAASTGLGHYEVLATLQYMRAKRPDLVASSLPEAPASPGGFDMDALKRMRADSLRQMPQILPKERWGSGGKSNYSQSVWLLKSSGFKDKDLENGRVEISFEGSTTTERPFLVEMLLLRAAEIARKRQHPAFSVRSLNHFNKITTINGVPTGGAIAYTAKMQVEFMDTLQTGDYGVAFSTEKVMEDLGPVYLQ